MMNKRTQKNRNRLYLEVEQLESRQMLAGDVTGFIFGDTNASGTKDAGEGGLNGWTVYVDSNRNGYRDTHEINATTNTSTGFYRLRNVGSREQLVRIEGRPTHEATNGIVQSVLVRDNQTTTAVNFGQQLRGGLGSVSGFVFEDVNRNSRRDTGETGGIGFTVYADLNRNGRRELVEPSATTTTSTGFYRLDNIPEGTTRLRVVPLETHRSTTGTVEIVDIRAGQTVINANFGQEPLGSGSVTGFIYSDTDADGRRDPGEPGLNGFTVYVDSNRNGYRDSNELAATTTTSTGFYRLNDVPAGRKNLRIEQPSTHAATDGGTKRITVRRDETTTGVNFGQQLRRTGSITGFVFSDTDADGRRDSGESGLVGWTVYVDSNRNGYRDPLEKFTTTTTTTGFYRLDDINVGETSIRVERRTTHVPTNVRSYTINVARDQTTTNLNFGQQLANGSSYVFNNLDWLFTDDDE